MAKSNQRIRELAWSVYDHLDQVSAEVNGQRVYPHSLSSAIRETVTGSGEEFARHDYARIHNVLTEYYGWVVNEGTKQEPHWVLHPRRETSAADTRTASKPQRTPAANGDTCKRCDYIREDLETLSQRLNDVIRQLDHGKH